MRWLKTWEKTPVLAVLAACLLCGPVAAEEGEPPAEKDIVVVVNGEAISRGQVDREMSGYQQRLIRTGQSLTPERLAGLREQIIDSLVDRALLHQESVRAGVTVSEEEVQAHWDDIRGQFPSPDAFENALDQMGMTEAQVRDEIRRGEAVQKLIRDRFESSAQVSEKEARSFYDTHSEAFVRPEQVRARHILVRPDPDGGEQGEQAAREKLQDLRKQAEGGKDFEELAKEHSEGPSSEQGGDLGYFPRGKMAKPFEDAAFALEPGEMSDVVKTRFGYHLIKLEDRKPEGVLPFEDVQQAVQQHLGREAVKEAVKSYVQQLREDAVIRRPGSKEKSG